HTTRAGGVRSKRAPGQSEARGAAGEPKKRWGLGYLNNIENIFKAAPALIGLTSYFTFLNNRLNRKRALI
ncbi:MAG: hypothetical protein IBX40_12845, partial [Methanosarcinales archaeon]|nr:hypothetical protein [Methanosarcinales archaeon]